MTIASMDNLVAALDGGERVSMFKTDAPGDAAGVFSSLWKAPGFPGAAATPPTGVGEAPTKATAGALPFTNPTAGKLAYLAELAASMAATGGVTLYDRLVHTSGLSGTVTTAQTVNSAAITRPDANGAGVECWMECYTALGVTSRTLTVTYTNQDGVAGRTGTLTVPATMPIGRMVPLQLQSGDTGVRSVQSVILSGSTGTAGDFGITLLRRITDVYVVGNSGADSDPFDLGLPRIYDNACLAALVFCSGITQAPVMALLTIAKN